MDVIIGLTGILLLDGVSITSNASYKRVCKDHFEASCFLDDMQARLMGYQDLKKVEKKYI